MGVLRRAGGTLAILREPPGQRRVPYLPADRIVELRDRRVREMAAFATAHVPHYRDLGLDPREIRTADDLAQLPRIDKKTVQADPERFRPDTPDRDDVRPFRTAGSTGIPLTIPHDRRSLLANIAWGERERDVEVRLCGKRYGYDVLQITHPGSADHRVREYYERVSFRPLRPRLHAATVADSVDDLLETPEPRAPARRPWLRDAPRPPLRDARGARRLLSPPARRRVRRRRDAGARQAAARGSARHPGAVCPNP